MAINWGKTWSQLNDEEALKSRKATGGIDWDTTRKQIEKEQLEAHQAEVKAAAQASKQQTKLKQRKLQTAPFAARAAETLAGLQEGGTQKQQTLGEVFARPTPSYPGLSIGERVGQTLAGMQEGMPSSVNGFAGATLPVNGEGLARTATNADQYGRGVIQNKIDELRNKGMQTDENGLGYFDTPEGEAELNAGLRELQSALRVLTGQDVKINGLAAAQDVLDSTPAINWGRWAQVDANAGQAMQAIENRKDTEARSAYEDYYNDWLHLMEREDFAEKSKYRSTETGEEYKPGSAMFGTSGFGDLMYDYINKNKTAVERQQLLDTTSGFSALGLDKSFLQTMTDTEVGIYNYLYATEGRDRANEYLQYIQNNLTARQRKQTQDWFRKYAQENPGKASAFSVLMAPARGLSYLGQMADLLTDGKIDQNAAYNKFADIPSTIREKVSRNWGPAGSFLYQTGMSMADFLMTLGISGGSNLSLAIMGSGAAADTVIDAKDRGLSDAQAFTLGTVAGVAEVLTERVSIESLLDMTTLGKSAVGYIAKNALSEAGEEASSSIINLLTDIIVSKDKSQWQQEIDRYFAQGMTKKQAANLALMNQAKSIGLDALGGALSGGLLAGGGAITNRVGEVQRQKDRLQSGLRMYGELQGLKEAGTASSTTGSAGGPTSPQAGKASSTTGSAGGPTSPQAGKASSTTGSAGGPPSPQAGKDLEEDRQDTENQQVVDISKVENQQGFEQVQNMPVQNNAQAVDVNQEVLNNEQGQVLSGNGPQRGSTEIDAGGAGAMGGNGQASTAGLRQSDVSRKRTERARKAGLTPVNSLEIGILNGTDTIRNIVLDDESMWDDELRNINRQLDDHNRTAGEKYGRKQVVKVNFVLGKMEVETFGGERLLINGVENGNGEICIQVNNTRHSATELFDHEMYHVYESETPGLTKAVWNTVQSVGLNDTLVEQYRRFYTEVAGYSDEMIREEILADAYAGLERISGTNMKSVRDLVRQLTGEAQEAIERGWYTPAAEETYESVDGEGRETRGPPTYSVAETEDGRMVAVVESDILANIDTSNWTDKVKKEAKSAAKKALLNFKDGVDVEGKTVKVNKRSRDEYTRSNDAERLHRQNRDAYADKMSAAANVDDTLKATAFGEPDGGLKHKRSDNFVDFVRGDVLIEAGTNQYEAQTVVGITDGGEYVFYDVVDIEPTTFTKTKEPSTAAASKNAASAIQESSFDQSVPQGATVVKARFSASDEEDAEGNELSVEQAEFFRDSKVRVDEYGDYGEQDGSLVPVYHATWNDEFTVFDADRLGEYTDKNAMDDWFAATAHVGFWFNTQDLSELKKVGKRSEKVYLNIKRPYRAGTLDGLAEDIATWTEDYIEEDTPAERGRAFAKWLEWNGYDGVMLNDEELGGVSFVALYPEQIKRVSNTRPTEAADIRYSVASESDAEQEDGAMADETDSDGNELSVEQEMSRRDLTPGQELSRKEQSVIKRAINSSRMQLRDIVPAGTKEAREVQQMQILDLARKLWENGEITQADIDEAYEEIWSKGAIVDRELADEYAELRADLKAGVTVSEELKRDITDYEKFRRANTGTLVMRNGEESDIDVRYRDWARDYPNFFPESIMEPADMLERAAEVAQMLKPTVKTMSELSRSGRDYDYESLKADFTDMVRTMELEILHPVQEITKKKKDQKEAERVASFRQIYKEVMDEVFKVKQRETFEPNPEYWHEVADDAWERMNERAEAIQTEWLRRLTKEGFKGTESLDELGVRIAGSVADYHLVGQVLENHRAAQAIQRDIKKAETKLKATAKEKQYAAGIVSGTFSEADITGDARPHVVLELADYYMMERTVGMDLINERRNDMYAEADYQVENLMQDKDAYKVSSSPVLFYRTPQRNMIRMYGREQGQKIYDFLFAPVEENEAERIRWVNKMYDEVRLVEGENGKRKPLNRKERALVQMVMEGRAAAEVVAAMEERQVVYDAADNLRNGQAIEDVVREFNLNKELSEAATGYATWLDTNDILQTTKGVDLKRIENAVELYARQYNRFYKAINDFLAAHGYEPIGFISGYAPHIQPEKTRNLLQSTLKMMGLSEGVTTLPASIAGRTYTYRPNKRWNPYFMSRHGDATEYDVTAGYESYVDYLSDILYHTDDTVRIRRAANYFRRTYAPDEISNNLSWAEGLRNASPEQKAEMLREQGKLKYTDAPSAEVTNELFDEYVSELYDNIKGQGKYSNFVNWLEDYANQLTGKQSLADRGMEVFAGRQSLNFANKLNRAFQRANVAGNLSTALNQTAQLPMIVADIGNVNTLLALKDYAVGKVRRDGFKEKSDFLTARKGMNNLVVDPADRVINIMFTPAQVADDLVSTIAARGAYIKAVRQGMSDAEAMRYADRKAEQIMGSRAKGSAPQAFRSKNPLWRMVNMFQIEALNAFEYVEQDVIIQGIKDIKQIDDRKGRAKATAALIGLLGKMLVAAFLWNRVTEELYGGSPAQFDLLGYAANFLASGNGLTANEQLLDWIDMAWERAFGEPLFDIDPDYNEEFDWANATGDLGYAISSDIPFVRNVAGVFGVGDQSLPMPNIRSVYDAGRSLLNNGASPETLDAALTAAGQFLPGGRQINKTYQGARTMIRGGRYYGYGENERLQYPVEDTTSNWIKALLFGPSGLSETAEFYAAGGDDGMSAGNTRKYQELMQAGMSAEMAMEVYEEYRRINRLETMTASEKATEFANTLDEMGIPEEQKTLAREAFMFWGMVPGEATKYDTFVEEGMDPEMAYELTETLGDLEPEDGRTSVSNLQKYQAVLEMTDVESTRYAALAGLMQDKELARLRAAYDYVQSGTYVEFLTAFDEAYPGESKSQERVETVLKQIRLDNEERAALWQMCGPKWKTDNNPFSKTVGREVARLIEEYYAEIDGE